MNVFKAAYLRVGSTSKEYLIVEFCESLAEFRSKLAILKRQTLLGTNVDLESVISWSMDFSCWSYL